MVSVHIPSILGNTTPQTSGGICAPYNPGAGPEAGAGRERLRHSGFTTCGVKRLLLQAIASSLYEKCRTGTKMPETRERKGQARLDNCRLQLDKRKFDCWSQSRLQQSLNSETAFVALFCIWCGMNRGLNNGWVPEIYSPEQYGSYFMVNRAIDKITTAFSSFLYDTMQKSYFVFQFIEIGREGVTCRS